LSNGNKTGEVETRAVNAAALRQADFAASVVLMFSKDNKLVER
jgi:hypothetical protein